MTQAVIAPALAGLVEPVTKVKPHPENPRKGNVEGIASSLQRFGQVRPIMVQASTSFIVAGNHTYRAARSLKWRTIAVVRVDMNDVEARAYMLADNRWSDVAENDDVALERLLASLEAEGGLAGTGYEPGDLDELRELLANVPPPPPGEDDPPAPGAADGRPGRVRGATVDVTLTLPAETKPAFSADLQRLREQWGTKGVTETILRAVAECIKSLE